MADIIDINVFETTETVAITVTPNLTTINVNSVTGGLVSSVNGQVGDVVLTIPNVSTLVPYSGATQDVNLGEFGLLTGNLEFDNTPTNLPTAAGSMYYNNTDGTVDLILKGGNVKLQIGQEQVVRVVNKTATNIDLLEANYQAVRVTGAQGQRMKVDLALATTDVLSAETIGIVTETIANNQEGFVTTSGLVRNINTTGSLQGETWADGDILYLSPTTAGNVTKVKPTAANHLIVIGYVIHSHATQGTIFVKVDNGYELDELHNVYITSVADKQLLSYDSASSLWKNKSVTTADIADSTNKRYQTDNQQSFNDATSSIQTQLNSKQNNLGYTPIRFLVKDAVPKTVTSAVTQVISSSYLIPANTLSSNDFIRIVTAGLTRTGTGSVSFRIYINSVNSLSGAQIIAQNSTISLSVTYSQMTRNLVVSNNIIKNVLLNTPNDVQNTVVALVPITINNAVDQYILVALSSTVSTDTITQEGLEITN